MLPPRFLQSTAIYGLCLWPASFLVFIVHLASWLMIISILLSLTWSFDSTISISCIGHSPRISRTPGLRHGFETITWPIRHLRSSMGVLTSASPFPVFRVTKSFFYAPECWAWVYVPTYITTSFALAVEIDLPCKEKLQRLCWRMGHPCSKILRIQNCITHDLIGQFYYFTILPITAILLYMRDKSANSDGEYLYSCPCTNTYSTRIHHVQICLVHVVLIRSVGISTLNTLQQGPLKDRRASSWEQQDIRFTVSCMGDTEHRKIHLLGGYISAIAIHAWQNVRFQRAWQNVIDRLLYTLLLLWHLRWQPTSCAVAVKVFEFFVYAPYNLHSHPIEPICNIFHMCFPLYQ
jgi:hypothetical protein